MINKGLGGDLAWLNGRPLYASISGGKDSAALGLWLQDQGIKFTPVFLDTGWEHPATYEYIKDVLTPQFGKFLVLRNDRYFDESEEPEWMGGMEQTIKYNKMFPSGVAKFCTRTLKLLTSTFSLGIMYLIGEAELTSNLYVNGWPSTILKFVEYTPLGFAFTTAASELT